jgi:hypothetical protein
MTIIREEGVKGLYRVFYNNITLKAYGATLGSFGPYSALYFLIYENMKKFVASDPKHPTFLQSAISSQSAFLIVT